MKRTAGIGSVIGAAFILFAGWYTVVPATYTIAPTSKLWVEGTSTVHDFSCNAVEFDGVFNTNAGSVDAIAGLEDVVVTVPVEKIDCGNGTMDKKMRGALKDEAYPEIRYQMTGASVEPATTDGTYHLNAKGTLTMAGEERPIDIAVEGTQLSDGNIRFVGSTVVRMSDFDVKRPSAALGTIKTGDEVTVRFEVIAAASGVAGK